MLSMIYRIEFNYRLLVLRDFLLFLPRLLFLPPLIFLLRLLFLPRFALRLRRRPPTFSACSPAASLASSAAPSSLFRSRSWASALLETWENIVELILDESDCCIHNVFSCKFVHLTITAW